MPKLIYDQYVIDDRPLTSDTGVFSSGQKIDKRTPIARKSITGELAKWNPSASDGLEKAIGLSVINIDTTSGAKEAPFHDGGCFNTELINWPDSLEQEKKAACFDGMPIATKKLG